MGCAVIRDIRSSAEKMKADAVCGIPDKVVPSIAVGQDHRV